MPRSLKRIVALFVDSFFCVLTVWFSFLLRLDSLISFSDIPRAPVFVSVFLGISIFIKSGLYRAIFRYSGTFALRSIAQAVGIYGIIYSTIFTFVGVEGVPRTVGLIQPVLLFMGVGFTRLLARYWLGGLYRTHLRHKALHLNAVIYGAGESGRQLASAMSNNKDIKIMGFIDDDRQLQGRVLNGMHIYAPGDLPRLVGKGLTDVLLALPSATRKRRNEIIEQMLGYRVAVRTLPNLADLARGKITISDICELDVDDLLGRIPVTPDHKLMEKNIAGKIVLVTGAGGSIGGELCRQIIRLHPVKLLLIEMNEYALYSIHAELEKLAGAEGGVHIVPLLATVHDDGRMQKIMETWRPHTVYHAAAYKHVPLVEHNPAEGIRNNVLGTLTTAQAAIQCGVSDFVLISTDKAVRPTNIMGASKRLAELILQALASTAAKTKFSMVRFGNVLDSSGSVVPKFREQIREGGPVTLTHLDIIRFFMTIPEAAGLVIQAGAMASGGDVFVLDMGQPVKIRDLAVRMIELSGLTVKDENNPHGDIEIIVTGLRPGEKLFEELLIGNNPQSTSHPLIMKAEEEFMPWSELKHHLEALKIATENNNVGKIRQTLEKLVSGYRPNIGIVDWIYKKKRHEGSVS